MDVREWRNDQDSIASRAQKPERPITFGNELICRAVSHINPKTK
jgi:hypothetical protein